MSRIDLAPHRELLLGCVLPAYARLGTLAFAHLHGSLVSGYTDQSDLDVVLVWDAADVPSDRGAIVERLDERRREFPESIDHQDIHIDRFFIGGQEYEVVHHTLGGFSQNINWVRTGGGDPGNQVVRAQELAAGLRHATFLTDARGQGHALQESLVAFPEHLKTRAVRVAQSNRERYLNELRTYARREDWFPFHSALGSRTRSALQALFAQREVYWTGDKWRRAAMVRFGFEPAIVDAYDRLWASASSADDRIVALEELWSLLDAEGFSGSPEARNLA
jgi:hypothetical protein